MKSRFKMCKFTRKRRSNKSRTVCIKVATICVEPGSVLEAVQLVVVAIVHELLIMGTIRLNSKCKNKKVSPVSQSASSERKVRACLILVRHKLVLFVVFLVVKSCLDDYLSCRFPIYYCL